MIDLVLLASSAVAALVPLLTKATEKGIEKVGEQVTVTLFDALKKRFSSPGAKECMDVLAKMPADPDAQAALRLQLRMAMEADPALAASLQEMLGKNAGPAATAQAATVTGNQSSVTQIVGSGNTAR
jgi:hypothetical protein